jgi:hypothetical protein
MLKQTTMNLDTYELIELQKLVNEISRYHGGHEHPDEFKQDEHKQLILFFKNKLSLSYEMGYNDGKSYEMGYNDGFNDGEEAPSRR